jgi:hypothetical protein
MFKHLFLIFTFTFLLFPSSCRAAVYYVAGDTGSDSNAGSITAPWKTIQKAANTVVAGDTVNVKGGVTYTGSNSCPSAAVMKKPLSA